MSKDKRKVKGTIDASSAGLVGILFIAGILVAILLLNSSVSSFTIASAASDGSAVNASTDSQTLNAPDTKAIHKNAKTNPKLQKMTRAQLTALQKAAAKRLKEAFDAGLVMIPAVPGPGDTPCYFGPYPNYATSQLPRLDASGNVIPGTGMRKFVDSLPGLGLPGCDPLTTCNANNLGQYIPVAVPDNTTYNGDDYYEIALVEYREKMHSDLNATKLRGYVQLSTANVPGNRVPLNYTNGTPILNATGQQVYAVDKPHYLGPAIIAQKDVPVRVKFTNYLPTGAEGDLFIPVDTTVMGSGPGPNHADGTPCDSSIDSTCEYYKQNRGSVHLHGGHSPWISDGTTHQWITPAGETTQYPQGVTVYNVPDMPDPGNGSLTFYFTNNQSARLMFYHDHSYGITRLNVYAGEAAAYMIQDPVELGLIANGTIPTDQILLVIQDKTFVPDNITNITNMWGEFDSQLAFQDPTWNTTKWGGPGDLWYPHVYMPMQNPYDPAGVSMFGRWHYSPWFWPPFMPMNGPVQNPYYNSSNPNDPMNPPMIPGTPNTSIVAEAFMDTPVVNGVAYPNLTVEPKAYRFRILNAADDRFWNLQLYQASSIVSGITITNGGSGYTSAPAVNITGDGTGATATATIDLTTGAVDSITLDTVGSGYTSATVTIAPPTTPDGVQATATATIYTNPTEVGMIPAIVPNACGPSTTAGAAWPIDGREGGVPDPATVGPSFIQIGNDGGFLPKPVVLPNQPVDWNMDPGTFDMGIVNKYTLFLGGAERADVIVDFSQYAGKTLILYNDAPAPVPANDPRLNYYTCDRDQTDTGGAPSTLPGYGPNTRTIMQIKVKDVAPQPFDLTALETAFASTATTEGAFAASQENIIVPEARYNSAYNATFPVDPFARIDNTSMTFTPIGSNTSVTLQMEFPTIQDEMGEAFDMYGRMSVLMGVERKPPVAFQQNMFLYNFFDPPTELVKPAVYGTQITTLDDGTEIWMITQNGVDTHPVHWHAFEVQLINRVAWDNNIRPPDDNELGWKDTLRVNPLQNTIVALRPIKLDVPFDIPNSIRPLDVTKPLGVILKGEGEIFDPFGNPIILVNHMVNFGWEYVWHCHILAHEENDMMRVIPMAIAPKAPLNLTATLPTGVSRVRLTWTDNSLSETHFTIQRATAAMGPWTTIATVPSATGPTNGTSVTFYDTTITPSTTYYYQVLANNIVGDTWDYGTVGFPTMTVDSAPSNTANVTTPGRRR